MEETFDLVVVSLTFLLLVDLLLVDLLLLWWWLWLLRKSRGRMPLAVRMPKRLVKDKSVLQNETDELVVVG